MNSTLTIAVADSYVEMALTSASDRPGWRLWFDRKRVDQSAGRRDAHPQESPIQRLDFTTIKELATVLEMARHAVLGQRHAQADRIDVHAHIGLHHSRVGLLELGDGGRRELDSLAINEIVKAWAWQILSIDSATHEIRPQQVANSSTVIVSCVQREVFDCIIGFARQHGYKFTSCLPAILVGIDELVRGPLTDSAEDDQVDASSMLVWTQRTRARSRGASVQLIQLINGKPCSSWRGYLNPPMQDCEDHELAGAIRRFKAFNKVPERGQVVFKQWPECSTALQTLCQSSLSPSESSAREADLNNASRPARAT